MNKHSIAVTAGSLALITLASTADAAIALDRTRAIYVSDAKSISLNITNENKELPFLAQAWIENAQHQKIVSPVVVLPPLQRVEAGERSVVRITKTPEAELLPQDRESVFYFNLREIPPKSSNAVPHHADRHRPSDAETRRWRDRRFSAGDAVPQIQRKSAFARPWVRRLRRHLYQ